MITKNGMSVFLQGGIFGIGPKNFNASTDTLLVNVSNEYCYYDVGTLSIPNMRFNHNINFSSYNLDTLVNSSNDYDSGLLIWIGDGANNLQPNLSNYNLGSPINKSDIIPSASYLLYAANGGFTVGVNFTNITNQSISINEIGLFGKSYYIRNIIYDNSSASAGNRGQTILLARDIIDTVALAPNETKEFTINIGVF